MRGVRQHPAMFVGSGDLDEFGDHVGCGLHHAFDDPGELGIGADRRAEQQPEPGPAVGDVAEVGEEAGLVALPGRLDAVRHGRERVEELASGVFEQFDVQRALAREVLVEHGLGDAGGVGDVVHRRRVETRRREHLTGDVEQLLAALIGGESHTARGYAPATLDFSGIT